MPKVSVIIPTYNRAWCLQKAIDSILDQTYQDFEVLIIDDGSTDKTKAIVANHSAPVRYYYQENRGFCAALNAGIERANGEYISFLNSDDVLLKDALRSGVEFMNNHPEIGFVYGQGQHVDISGRSLFVKKSVLFKDSCIADGTELVRELLFCFRVEINGMIVRRECFKKVGKFPENCRFAGESPWLVRLAKEYRFGYIAEPFTIVLHHPGQLMWRCDPKGAEAGYLAALAEIFEDPVLGERFRSLKDRTYSTYYQWIAGHAYGKDMTMARRYLRKALLTCPQSSLKAEGFGIIYLYLKSFVPERQREAIRGFKRRLSSLRTA